MRPICSSLLASTILISTLFSPINHAQALKPQASERVSMIRAYYQSPAELQAIASQFQHIIVDQKSSSVQTEAYAADIAALAAAGIKVNIEQAATAVLRAGEDAMLQPPEVRSIGGFACYRTVEETYTTMANLAANNPNLAQVIDIGPSFEKTRNASLGYTMKVLVLGNRSNDSLVPVKPNMVVFSSIHAREYTPAELMTRFAESLVSGYGTDPEATWLLDHNRYHLILQANPDGRKKAETGLSWRKNTNQNYCGANSSLNCDCCAAQRQLWCAAA